MLSFFCNLSTFLVLLENTFLKKSESVTSESVKLKKVVYCLEEIFREAVVIAFSGR